MKKILAILLAALMIFSLAACGAKDENNGANTDAQNQTNETEESTDKAKDEDKEEEKKEEEASYAEENEIFKYVMDAYDATLSYDGDMTADGTLVSESAYKYRDQEEIEKDKYTSTATMVFNGNDKTVYNSSVMDRGDSKSESYTKTVRDGDALYVLVEQYRTGGENQTRLYRVSDNDVEEYTSIKSIGILSYMAQTYNGVALADSFEELKDAMDTTLIPIVTYAYGEELAGATPTVTYDLSAKTADEVRTLIINTKVSSEITTDGITTKFDINMYYEISAKDGKVINYKAVVDYISEEIEGEKVLEHRSSAQSIDITYDYSFAKDKYDSLEVILPEDTSTIPESNPAPTEYEDVHVYDVYINGVETMEYFNFYACVTPQDALDEISEKITRGMGTLAGNVRVFTDEAMTQELTADNVTKEKILGLTEVYISVTPSADVAFVVETIVEREEYSKPYQIVMPTVYLAGAFTSGGCNYGFEEPGEYQLDETHVENEKYELWINGVKQDTKPTSITLEAGKTYKIEYVNVKSDKDFAK